MLRDLYRLLPIGKHSMIWAFSTHICSYLRTLLIYFCIYFEWKLLSRFRLFVIPWTIQFMDSPGHSTAVGTIPFSGELFNPGIKPRSPTLQADSLSVEPPGKPIYFNTYLLVPTQIPIASPVWAVNPYCIQNFSGGLHFCYPIAKNAYGKYAWDTHIY